MYIVGSTEAVFRRFKAAALGDSDVTCLVRQMQVVSVCKFKDILKLTVEEKGLKKSRKK